MKNKISEIEVAAKLVKWLMEQGWEVYQEVQLDYWTTVDICAVKRDEKIAWLIEVKTSINKILQRQVNRHRCHYTHISAAVPYPKRYTARRDEFIKELKNRGIGFIHIHDSGEIEIVNECNPDKDKFCLKNKNEKLFNLPEEYKTYCMAGSQHGFLTPYKLTCLNIVDYVKEHPGCSLKEVVLGVSHHYKTDQGAISTLSKYGIKGVEFITCLYVEDDNE